MWKEALKADAKTGFVTLHFTSPPVFANSVIRKAGLMKVRKMALAETLSYKIDKTKGFKF